MTSDRFFALHQSSIDSNTKLFRSSQLRQDNLVQSLSTHLNLYNNKEFDKLIKSEKGILMETESQIDHKCEDNKYEMFDNSGLNSIKSTKSTMAIENLDRLEQKMKLFNI